jgi:uncharacterized RDD family membrane protein YckC
VQNSALATALDPQETQELERPQPPQARPRIVTPQARPSERRNDQPAFQASLFGPQEVGRIQDTPSRPARNTVAAPKTRRDKPVQRSLEFPEPDKLESHSTVQSSIYCNARVAPAPLRVAAVVFDFVYPAAAVGVFWAALYFTGQSGILAQMPLWLYPAILGLVTLLYRTLYCLGNTDSPGIRWAGLKLLDFDGRQPTRQQRVKRFTAGCISIVAAGLGVIWALLDEERLTWHDHMSGTFATIADQSLFIAHK